MLKITNKDLRNINKVCENSELRDGQTDRQRQREFKLKNYFTNVV